MGAQVRFYEKSGCEFSLVDVKVGDIVGFKSDHEQHGKIIEIKATRNWDGRTKYSLVLENKNGFGGDYLRYATRTEEDALDCWAEKKAKKSRTKKVPRYTEPAKYGL